MTVKYLSSQALRVSTSAQTLTQAYNATRGLAKYKTLAPGFQG